MPLPSSCSETITCSENFILPDKRAAGSELSESVKKPKTMTKNLLLPVPVHAVLAAGITPEKDTAFEFLAASPGNGVEPSILSPLPWLNPSTASEEDARSIELVLGTLESRPPSPLCVFDNDVVARLDSDEFKSKSKTLSNSARNELNKSSDCALAPSPAAGGSGAFDEECEVVSPPAADSRVGDSMGASPPPLHLVTPVSTKKSAFDTARRVGCKANESKSKSLYDSARSELEKSPKNAPACVAGGGDDHGEDGTVIAPSAADIREDSSSGAEWPPFHLVIPTSDKETVFDKNWAARFVSEESKKSQSLFESSLSKTEKTPERDPAHAASGSGNHEDEDVVLKVVAPPAADDGGEKEQSGSAVPPPHLATPISAKKNAIDATATGKAGSENDESKPKVVSESALSEPNKSPEYVPGHGFATGIGYAPEKECMALKVNAHPAADDGREDGHSAEGRTPPHLVTPSFGKKAVARSFLLGSPPERLPTVLGAACATRAFVSSATAIIEPKLNCHEIFPTKPNKEIVHTHAPSKEGKKGEDVREEKIIDFCQEEEEKEESGEEGKGERESKAKSDAKAQGERKKFSFNLTDCNNGIVPPELTAPPALLAKCPHEKLWDNGQGNSTGAAPQSPPAALSILDQIDRETFFQRFPVAHPTPLPPRPAAAPMPTATLTAGPMYAVPPAPVPAAPMPGAQVPATPMPTATVIAAPVTAGPMYAASVPGAPAPVPAPMTLHAPVPVRVPATFLPRRSVWAGVAQKLMPVPVWVPVTTQVPLQPRPTAQGSTSAATAPFVPVPAPKVAEMPGGRTISGAKKILLDREKKEDRLSSWTADFLEDSPPSPAPAIFSLTAPAAQAHHMVPAAAQVNIRSNDPKNLLGSFTGLHSNEKGPGPTVSAAGQNDSTHEGIIPLPPTPRCTPSTLLGTKPVALQLLRTPGKKETGVKGRTDPHAFERDFHPVLPPEPWTTTDWQRNAPVSLKTRLESLPVLLPNLEKGISSSVPHFSG